MIADLTYALVAPPLLFMKLLITLSWPTALTLSALVALVWGAMLFLSDHNRQIRWILLPMALAHVHILALSTLGSWAWWAVLGLVVASIAWLIWATREVLAGGLLLAYFCLVYCGISASVLFIGF